MVSRLSTSKDLMLLEVLWLVTMVIDPTHSFLKESRQH
jgi:hypothetical protein